jgi:hypothetical protein
MQIRQDLHSQSLPKPARCPDIDYEATTQEHQMFPFTSTGKFSNTAVFSAVLLLAGCGGGSDAGTEQAADLETDHHHEPAQQPPNTIPAQPAPAPDATETVAAAAPPPLAAAALSTLVSTESIKLATTYTPLVPATINAVPYWPVWYGNGQIVDGVGCFRTAAIHLHSLISIYKDGKRRGLPANIGRLGCYHAYELHVHDVTGIIHMETDLPKKFKLGQWFSLWGQPLSRTGTAGLAGPVRFYVIEKGTVTRFDGNPYDIEMVAHREILIVAGTEMSVVPRYQWPSGL